MNWVDVRNGVSLVMKDIGCDVSVSCFICIRIPGTIPVESDWILSQRLSYCGIQCRVSLNVCI